MPPASVTLTLDGPVAERPRAARRWALDRCAERHLDLGGFDLALLVSELVTNACTHGAEPVCLRLELGPHLVRVEVEDGSPELPSVQRPGRRSVGGRGMRIVASLSRRWGAQRVGGGKVVWAEVPVGPPSAEAVGAGTG